MNLGKTVFAQLMDFIPAHEFRGCVERYHGWIAISVYVLLSIVRKRLGLKLNLYPISQILSLTLFEKVPLLQAFSQSYSLDQISTSCNQLDLFEL